MRALRGVLANPALARVEAAWAGASLGNWAFAIVLALYAYRHGGVGAVALALVARMLPAALAAPYAAALADGHSRRSILLWSSWVRVAALLGAASAVGLGATLGVVLVFAAVFAIAHTAHRPAQAALMPQLARTPAELAAANVVLSVISNAGFLLGSLLAGVLVSLTGTDVGFVACAAAHVAVALIIRPLLIDVRPSPLDERVSGIASLAEGIRAVRAHTEMRLLVSVFAVKALVEGVFDVLVIVSAIELLSMGESGAGWLNAAWGIGGVLGGAASLTLLARGGLAKGLTAGLAMAGFAFGAVAAWPAVGAAIPALVVMGAGFSLVEAAQLTLIQRLAPDDVMARVFGVEETIDVVAVALGSVVAAGLVAVLDVRGAILAGAVVLPAVALAIAGRVATWEAGTQVPERTFALVRNLSLFAPLPIAALENIALRLSERSYRDGETIIVQGEAGDAFFVIDAGAVQVEVDKAPRRQMGAGEFFGEIALLRDVARTGTVRALGSVTALVIERDQFLAAVGAHARSAAAAETVATTRLTADATSHE
ncbi:MAG TPA: MFS transporter [Solirubrobacteraceae bacterium]|nr:MFS transporter [Solirubrobacteraceae bacterium]